MATESPIRIMEASEKWPANKTVEDLGPLFNGKFKGDWRNVVPNRCESAPPSMEGSFTSIHKLMTHQNATSLAGFANPKSSMASCEPHNERRANSGSYTYESSYVGMNTRLSLPLNSWDNEPLDRCIASLGRDWKVNSLNECGKRSSQSNLPTHREEPEDEGSPQGTIDVEAQPISNVRSTQVSQVDITSTHKSANSLPCLARYGSLEEAVDHDTDTQQVACSDSQIDPISASSFANCSNGTSVRPSLYRTQLPAVDIDLVNNLSSGNVTESDLTSIEDGMKALDIYATSSSESNSVTNQLQGSQINILQPLLSQQQSSLLQAQGFNTEITSRGISYAYGGIPQLFHGPSTFSATDGQPILQSSGYTPPLYASAAALMTSPASFYHNPPLPGYIQPQFVGGNYATNPTVHLPYLASYPPYGAVPQAYQGVTSPTSEVTIGGNSMHSVDPHLNRFYGQLGFAIQPSFTDPLHLQYFQHPFRNAFSFSGQLDCSTSREGSAGSPALDLRKGAEVVTHATDHNLQFPGLVGHSVMNQRRGDIRSPYYLGSPPNVSPSMQYPSSPVSIPILPGLSVAGTSSRGGRNENRFSSLAGRNTGSYSVWQGQGLDNSTCSLLEELKSGKGRRFELADIAGHIVEFSADQHGSRFIQQKLENCSSEEKAAVFQEILPHAAKLMTDVFGNYVIQKFFEYGTKEQRKDLADQLEGQVFTLSFQMYGCRVIQKALEVIELAQKVRLVHELDGQIMRCVRDQNGNHVIQKCIESIPSHNIQFIISSFRGQVAQLSTHPYGCRVIQRVLEHCTNELQSQFIVDEILESVCTLAQDQYGNYVTQHVLERGRNHERSEVISKLSGRIVQLSQHKFASNVIEKCLEYGDPASRELLIGEIIGQSDGNDNLLVMMKDQYANYVVQKILHMCSDTQRETLLSRIKDHLNSLKKYTYGKHIAARFEQLYGEDAATEA